MSPDDEILRKVFFRPHEDISGFGRPIAYGDTPSSVLHIR